MSGQPGSEALWPARHRAAASNNLRQAVFVARRALDSCGDDGAARIAVAHDVVGLSMNRLEIDVEEFEAAALAADAERATSANTCARQSGCTRASCCPGIGSRLGHRCDPTNFFHLNENIKLAQQDPRARAPRPGPVGSAWPARESLGLARRGGRRGTSADRSAIEGPCRSRPGHRSAGRPACRRSPARSGWPAGALRGPRPPGRRWDRFESAIDRARGETTSRRV